MSASNKVIPYSYDRTKVTAGILHIGVGNFHRAHEAFLTDKLLCQSNGGDHSDQSGWGICGAMLLPYDERLFKALKAQSGEYTLTVCGRDGTDEVHKVGSLVELLWAVEDPNAVMAKVADPSIRIISLTITEGGYNIDKASGEFMLGDASIQHDLANPQTPKTVFGFVAEGLRRRMAAKNSAGGGITILSCDNLQHNGDTTRKAFLSFAKAQDAALAAWMAVNVSFPNSMVDRITPATRPEDVARLCAANGVEDAAPVYCEDFIQWVMEDTFIAGRPAWERVGAEFTDNVAAFENMKLSLLNASHMLLSYPSFLAGYRKVDDAMADARITKFVRAFMDADVTPFVPSPSATTDLAMYKQTLIERFANRSVSDQVARLCLDGAAKFPVYVMPVVKKMLASSSPTTDFTRVAYLFAAYRHYLKYRVDDKGAAFTIVDPWLTEEDFALIGSEDPMAFLDMSPFRGAGLGAAEAFSAPFVKFAAAIKANGAMATLETIL